VYNSDGAEILVDDSDEEIKPENLTLGHFKLIPVLNLANEVVDVKAIRR
jgi:hypothetical protein